jgi:hypothetical protein
MTEMPEIVIWVPQILRRVKYNFVVVDKIPFIEFFIISDNLGNITMDRYGTHNTFLPIWVIK